MGESLKKEFLEGIRTYKFLTISAVFLFFSLLNPILNKLVLPNVLRKQFNGISNDMLKQMVITTQRDSVRAYLTDTFEIATLVVVLVLATLIAGELRNRTFILPACSHKDFATTVTAKMLVYGGFIMGITTLAVVIDFYYSGILFGTDMIELGVIIRSGILQGLYYIFVLSLVMIIGVFFTKPLAAGLVTLVPAYGTHVMSKLLDVQKYTPSGLLNEANLLSCYMNPDAVYSIIITIVASVLLLVLTVKLLEKRELARR